MKYLGWTIHSILVIGIAANHDNYEIYNFDRFNYDETDGRDFGPADWDNVYCYELDECLGWPDSWEVGVGWNLRYNTCQWCPATGNNCRRHKQSPINLERSPSTSGHDPECYDFHWISYRDGTCDWYNIVKNGYSKNSNNFKIERHALQIEQPLNDRGELECKNKNGDSRFPNMDLPMGFGDFWHLGHTELTVPSEHTQEGKRYDAEVHLAHFYEIDDYYRRLAKIAIFLQADASKERWSYLDKLICQWREVEEETRDECGLESVPPYPGCRNPTRGAGDTNLPSLDPYPFIDCSTINNTPRICQPDSCCEAERSQGSYCQEKVYDKYGDDVVGSICWWCCPGKHLAPPTTDRTEDPPDDTSTPGDNNTSPSSCPAYSNSRIKMDRICKDGGCCDPKRSSSNYCHFVYKFFGDDMDSVCSNCCEPSKELAPAPPQHPIYDPIDCTNVTNTFRICKRNSCCANYPSDTPFCNGVTETYPDNLESICWYCCSEPIDIQTSTRRLVGEDEDEEEDEEEVEEIGFQSFQQNIDLDPNEKVKTGPASHLRQDQSKEKATEQRKVEEIESGDNYINVPYSPYAWMRKVKTEYFFRYEGSQMVPPCYETVHYRVMKDPILIHPDQLAELERLLAWRIAPKGSAFNECQLDTAGKERPGSNGDAVDLNRPLQSYNDLHYKVFCECKDWDSKFDEDIEWCKLSEEERHTTHPYNFESGGGY